MIHATVGIITNVRLDHVDIMGYSLPEIASVLGKTIPAGQHCFTSEKTMFPLLKELADKKKTIMHLADTEMISDKEMSGFKYLEHKENVALSVAVCEHLGIDRETALKGMYNAIPDAGVLNVHSFMLNGKKVNFYNAFAANDPQSTMMIVNNLINEHKFRGTKIILINTRQDRLDRARQLSSMTGENLSCILDYLILIGQSTDMVENLCAASGVSRSKIINLGWTDPQNALDAIVSYTDTESTVIGIGNMGGMGAPLAELFEQRSFIHG
jgi:poly-gamma-glutamate synthase PgsB/CapB